MQKEEQILQTSSYFNFNSDTAASQHRKKVVCRRDFWFYISLCRYTLMHCSYTSGLHIYLINIFFNLRDISWWKCTKNANCLNLCENNFYWDLIMQPITNKQHLYWFSGHWQIPLSSNRVPNILQALLKNRWFQKTFDK